MITPASCIVCRSRQTMVLKCPGGPSKLICASCGRVLRSIRKHWTEPVIVHDRQHMWPSRPVK
jgi:ribosomal protein L34E